MTPTLESDSAAAYAVLAPAYDLLTARYAYPPTATWRTVVDEGPALLDVGCGPGKSFTHEGMGCGGAQ